MKIITFHGDVETTSYFMTQIEKQLEADGFDICPLDHREDYRESFSFEQDELTNAVFLTINFAGAYSKDPYPAQGEMLIDIHDMRIVNILVDHPYHYHDFLYEQEKLRRVRYTQFCIDADHVAYMKKFFPDIRLGGFIPTAGTELSDDPEDRDIDILFAGTYVPPEGFNVFIDRNGPEYSAFYHSMLDEVLADPAKRLEEVVSRRLSEEIEDATFEDIRLTLGHIQFLDYYVRYARRGAVIEYLADWESDDGRHLNITIAGSGWDTFVQGLRHPGRIKLLPYMDSEEVLRLMKRNMADPLI